MKMKKKKRYTVTRADIALVRAAVRTFIREVLPVLEESMAPYLEDGERLPDLAHFATMLLRRVGRGQDRVAAAEVAHARAGEALSEARCRRDAACGQLKGTLSEMRDVSRSLSGRSGALLVHLARDVPEQPHGLLRHSRFVMDQLHRRPPTLPAGCPIAINPAEIISALEPACDALRKALDEIDTGSAKLAALDDQDVRARRALNLDCARSFGALAELTGLAERSSPAGT